MSRIHEIIDLQIKELDVFIEGRNAINGLGILQGNLLIVRDSICNIDLDFKLVLEDNNLKLFYNEKLHEYVQFDLKNMTAKRVHKYG